MMQLELATPIVSRKGGALKKVCAAGALALAGCIAFTKMGDVVELDFVATTAAPKAWADVKKELKEADFKALKKCDDAIKVADVADLPGEAKACVDAAVKHFKDKAKNMEVNAKTEFPAVTAHIDTIVLAIKNWNMAADSGNADFPVPEAERFATEAKKEALQYLRFSTDHSECSKVPAECEKKGADASAKKVNAKACLVKAGDVADVIAHEEYKKLGAKSSVAENSAKVQKCVTVLEKCKTYIKANYPDVETGSDKAEYTALETAITNYKSFLMPTTNIGLIIALTLLSLALVGGGAYYYFYVFKKKAGDAVKVQEN